MHIADTCPLEFLVVADHSDNKAALDMIGLFSQGKLPSIGSTVDLENATWSNTIGASELVTAWKDPDFDARQSAFYYARLLEIPTPRWTTHDVKRFGVKPLPGTRMTITERAYTSPIWYTPK